MLRWLSALVCGLAIAAGVLAQDVLPVPPLSGRVIDQTGTLSAAQRQALDARLAAIETERGSQIVVLMLPSTRPEDIAAYAQRVADTWKIGRRQVGDGVLIVVAKVFGESRHVRQLHVETVGRSKGRDVSPIQRVDDHCHIASAEPPNLVAIIVAAARLTCIGTAVFG